MVGLCLAPFPCYNIFISSAGLESDSDAMSYQSGRKYKGYVAGIFCVISRVPTFTIKLVYTYDGIAGRKRRRRASKDGPLLLHTLCVRKIGAFLLPQNYPEELVSKTVGTVLNVSSRTSHAIYIRCYRLLQIQLVLRQK